MPALQQDWQSEGRVQIDCVAVHWYNCDLPSLKDHLETGANLPGFEQFGKPIG